MINGYFQRKIDVELQDWAKSPNHKTLLLRGARQVGKSSAIRQLGKSFKYFIEVNFDEEEEIKKLKTDLTREMQNYSNEQKFEEAALIRDKITKLEYITKPQIPSEYFIQNPNL